MAGIAGFVTLPSRSRPDKKMLDNMVAALTWTGEETVKKYATADFSGAAVFHKQGPESLISNEDGTITALLDGEVYVDDSIAASLRKQGYLLSHDDRGAELCVHLYEQYGRDFVKHLNGSWALAIYDARADTLLLTVDRFSSRLLFYSEVGHSLVFGSTLDTVSVCPEINRALNKEAIAEFLVFQRVLGVKTPYQEVVTLGPATTLQWRNGQANIVEYWQPKFEVERNRSLEDYADEFIFLLQKSLRRVTRPHLNYGVLLSAGIDSRLILGLLERPVRAYTFSDWENREIRLARSIAEVCHVRHKMLLRKPDHYAQSMENAVRQTSGMFDYLHAHMAGLWHTIHSDGIEALLHGDLMDSFFKGWFFPRKPRFLRVLGKSLRLPSSLARKLGSSRHLVLPLLGSYDMLLFKGVLRSNFYSVVESVVERFWREMLPRAIEKTGSFAQGVEYIGITSSPGRCRFIPLVIDIRNHVLERGPLWDNDLFDLHCRLPAQFKWEGSLVRSALVRAAPALAGIPEGMTGLPVRYVNLFGGGWRSRVIGRMLSLPRLLSTNRQMPSPMCTDGSWQNMAEVLRAVGKFKQLFSEIRRDRSIFTKGLFKAEDLWDVWLEHLAGKGDHTNFLLSVLLLYVWLRQQETP